jgi:hypothetical protein
MSVLPGTFGAELFGGTPFGGVLSLVPLDPDANILFAYHVTSQSIRVDLDLTVKALDPTVSADALYRFNWRVTRLDGTPCPAVLYVESLLPDFEYTYSVILHLAGPEGTIRDKVLVTGSTSIPTVRGGVLRGNTFQMFGALNPPSQPATVLDGVEDLATGSPLDPTGDLQIQSPRATTYKMILRVLTTVAGGFTYLPDWGSGVIPKSLATQSNIADAVSRAKAGILALPGVVGASINATMNNAQGMLTFQVTVKTQTLGDIVVTHKVATGV